MKQLITDMDREICISEIAEALDSENAAVKANVLTKYGDAFRELLSDINSRSFEIFDED